MVHFWILSNLWIPSIEYRLLCSLSILEIVCRANHYWGFVCCSRFDKTKGHFCRVLENSTHNRYGFDILYIQIFVQVGSILSNWFWLVYLVLPGFLVWKGFGYLMMYLQATSQGGQNTEQELTPEQIKKMEKNQRKQDLADKRMMKFK